MNLKMIWIAAFAIIVVAIANFVHLPKNHAVTVGASLPLTGDLAPLGEEVRRGIELAQEDATARGITIDLVFEDNQYNPAMTASAAHKLTAIDRIDVGITMTVEESRSAGPIFQSNRTPLLMVWDSNASIVQAGEFVFSNGFSTEKVGERMAEHAYQNLHLRRVAILGHKDAWKQDIPLSR